MSSKEWKTYKLGDLVAINESSIGKLFQYKQISYLDTSSVTQNTYDPLQLLDLNDAPSRAKRIVKVGDTIISTVRPIQKHFGFIKKIKPNTIVSTGFAVLTPKKIVPEFLYYFITQDNITNYLNGIAETSTTTFPAFRPDVLNDLEILLPDNQTQTIIASILSSLDDKIELNRQTNQTLEGIAQTLFQEMCVPKGEELPEGWRVEPLDEVANFLNGLALQKFPANDETDYLPAIKIRELKSGITSSTDKISRSIPEKYIINNGDLLFSWSATLEVMFWCYGEGALNQHLFKVSSEKYPLWFCYMLINYHIDEFRRIASDKTTTMGHIQRKHLTEALCFIPKNFEEIGNLISPIIEQIKTNNYETQTLIALRDSLLPKLMKGEIEI